MLNSAACRMKTARAPVGAPACEKSSRSKGLTQGDRARYRPADETGRNVFQEHSAILFCAIQVEYLTPRSAIGFTLMATTDAFARSDLDVSRYRYRGRTTGRSLAVYPRNQPRRVTTGLFTVFFVVPF